MSNRTRAAMHHVEPRGGAAPSARRGGRAFGWLTRRRVIVGLACLFSGAVVINALMLQTGKHPAPLFRSFARAPAAFPLPPSRFDGGVPVRSAVFAPSPLTAGKPAPIERGKPATAATLDPGEALLAEIQRELGKRGYYKGDPDGKPGPMTTQAIRDFQFAQRVAIDGTPTEALLREVVASKVTMKDELLDLVRRASVDDRASRTVMDIQRALNKAGYGPLTEDGQMGPSTKQALSRFETDRKLPPRGEPSGPVLKLLASASGIQIN